MSRMKIAVAGSGISGLSAAWLLSEAHDVTLFERDNRIGGHSNTVQVEALEGAIGIDTGFIVYNTACYPNLIALFDHLDVSTAATKMGFAVSLDGGGYEYAGGSGARGLFGQPSNMFNLAHWQMVRDILRFFKEAESLTHDDADPHVSLGQWLHTRDYSRAFIEHHILPMAAAIWSAPASALMAYPAVAFAKFFANHGLLQVRNRPQWRTVVGGSRVYVSKLLDRFKGRVVTGNGARSISRNADSVTVHLDDGTEQRFDHLVIATHADDALALLRDPSADERNGLSAFSYQPNTAVLHRDPALMPKRRRVWTSWNYVGLAGADQLCVSYWMNALQPLPTTTDYFVTLNPPRDPAPGTEIVRVAYAHPVFDTHAIEAQRDLHRLQGQRRTWFAGSYFGAGFHEDGLQAGLWVAEQLGGTRRPWIVANESSRIYGSVAASARSRAEAVA
jgi:uncharacterized protein